MDAKTVTRQSELYNAVDDVVRLMGEVESRISYHHPSCRGGDFAKCRCANAVAARRLSEARVRLLAAAGAAEEG